MISSCTLFAVASLALGFQESSIRSSIRCISPGNLRTHTVPPFVTENTYTREITQNQEPPSHDQEPQRIAPKEKVLLKVPSRNTLNQYHGDDGVGVQNTLPADLQGLPPYQPSELPVDATHDTPLTEEEALQLLQDSLSNAVLDVEQLHQENEELNRQVKSWRERGNHIMNSKSTVIAGSKGTVEKKTSDKVDTTTSMKPVTLFPWGFQFPPQWVSAIRNESAHAFDTLRPFMDTRATFAYFMIVILLVMVLARHKDSSGSSFAWSKLQALGLLFRRVAMDAHSVEIAEIYVAGISTTGAVRLTIQAGLTGTETKKIEDVEGFFVRFPGTFTFSLRKSDTPCHFSVLADENYVIAHAEIPANELVELAQGTREYHQAALILNREIAGMHIGVQTHKPYVAMRIRDVTYHGIRGLETALPGK